MQLTWNSHATGCTKALTCRIEEQQQLLSNIAIRACGQLQNAAVHTESDTVSSLACTSAVSRADWLGSLLQDVDHSPGCHLTFQERTHDRLYQPSFDSNTALADQLLLVFSLIANYSCYHGEVRWVTFGRLKCKMRINSHASRTLMSSHGSSE